MKQLGYCVIKLLHFNENSFFFALHSVYGTEAI